MNDHPTCRASVRADLKAFADGELSPLARWRVARHLRTCLDCRQELIQMQTLSTELQEAEGETTPLDADLRAHILESVPTTNSEEENFARLRQRRIARKKAVLALGACAVAGLFIATASQSFLGSSAPDSVSKRANTGSIASDASSPSGGAVGAASSAASPSTSANGGHSSGIIVGGKDGHLFTDGHVKTDAGLGVSRSNETNANASNNVTFATRSVSGMNVSPEPAEPDTFANEKAALRRERQNWPVPSSAHNADEVKTSIQLSNPAAAEPLSVLPPSRVVHREGSMSVSVANAENASDDATTILKNAGGFIASTALETGSNQKRTATLDCRVPVAQFETVVRKIGALGTVRAKSLNGQDITAQVARSGARRQALSQELSIAQARLDERENSKKKADTYELRAEVRTARIQAAEARAQLEALQKYGSLSSLYISLQDASPVPTPKAVGWTDSLSPTSRAAWDAFTTNIRLPLQLLLWVLAYSPLWLPLLLIWRKFGRKWLEA